jgi:competence protein ComEC
MSGNDSGHTRSIRDGSAADRRTGGLLRQPAVVWVTIGLLVGQALAGWTQRVVVPATLILMGTACLLRRRFLPTPLGFSLLAAALGFFQMDHVLRPRFPARHVVRFVGSSVQLRGKILERPARQTEHTRLVLEIEAVFEQGRWEQSVGQIQVTVARCEQPWRRGDDLEAALHLDRPANFGNPGEFDYEAYLARRGIYVTAFAATDAAWQRRSGGWMYASAIEEWRDRIASVIDATLTGADREILAALIIGGTELGAATQERYARTGLSHVLSISGLHISLVAGAGFALARWLLCRSEWLLLRASVPKLAMGIAVIPVLLYAGLAGGTVPTLRSLIMGVLLAAAVLVDRRHQWLANLSAAALVISLVWPGSALDISFQLSFSAVLAIVLGMRRLVLWWNEWEETHLIRLRPAGWRRLRVAVMYVGVSFCASAGTLPLTAWHFNLVSCIGPLANLVLVPVLSLPPVSLGLLGALAALFSGAVASWLIAAAGAVVHLADAVVAFVAGLPGAAVHVVSPSLFELLLVYAALGALLLKPRPRRLLLIGCALLLCLDAACWYAWRYHRSGLRITFLSVGHGDCTIVEFPGSEVLVVDGGGLSPTFDVGQRVVAPYLWKQKIGRVDTLVLTHPDFDHYGGLAFLAREFGPDELWWNETRGAGPRFEAFWKTVQEQGIPPRAVRRGFRRSIGGVDVLALAPEGTGGSDNDRSVTLRVRYGPTVVLLPGDMERTGEQRLAATLAPLLRSRILKVPHHGSVSSSSAPFLDAVAPEMAIASVGRGRRFGLPHASVINAYRARGIPVVRTDREGAVILDIGADGTVLVTLGRSVTAEGSSVRKRLDLLSLDTRTHRGLIRRNPTFQGQVGTGAAVAGWSLQGGGA